MFFWWFEKRFFFGGKGVVQFLGCSRGCFVVVLRSSYIAMMELMMIFEILEWGGRGMRFVKIAEWYVGFGFFDIHKYRFVDHQNTK